MDKNSHWWPYLILNFVIIIKLCNVIMQEKFLKKKLENFFKIFQVSVKATLIPIAASKAKKINLSKKIGAALNKVFWGLQLWGKVYI